MLIAKHVVLAASHNSHLVDKPLADANDLPMDLKVHHTATVNAEHKNNTLPKDYHHNERRMNNNLKASFLRRRDDQGALRAVDREELGVAMSLYFDFAATRFLGGLGGLGVSPVLFPGAPSI